MLTRARACCGWAYRSVPSATPLTTCQTDIHSSLPIAPMPDPIIIPALGPMPIGPVAGPAAGPAAPRRMPGPCCAAAPQAAAATTSSINIWNGVLIKLALDYAWLKRPAGWLLPGPCRPLLARPGRRSIDTMNFGRTISVSFLGECQPGIDAPTCVVAACTCLHVARMHLPAHRAHRRSCALRRAR